MKPSRDIGRLIEIMAALRTPGTGCPWDLDQTFATIAPYTIEEAYEVADAIERDDRDDLKDELGDLLLQVVYHARLAEEEGAFQFGDVVEAITRKMIRRHPHVFENAARDQASIKRTWSAIKAEERAERAAARGHDPAKERATGLLGDIPVTLPAFARAIKLQDKAAKTGFDWPSIGPVFDKLKEEIAELEEEMVLSAPSGRHPVGESVGAASGGRLAERESPDAIKEEFGDMLFVMANIARHLEIDPEAALRSANQKFVRRFAHIEARLAESGRTPEQSTLAEMDAFWDEAKAIDKLAKSR
ncbi:nucleoside triphosphate pyrophosphohydrolase [Hyphomicrobium methylovorum]|uniref:nucleoside triphosphate pyrophosphohydrolase n=1 Tax=Hyphomicrobium methylovorum TaxID=84 RepID=UPI0015E6DDE7|nr:nucleoside triphosphate pyrophosphohydrolase [Hyphomicrobium methylovorum]MBA2127770.1 nucleoside triphosphate pyrophosphohydrolase [Hyphomicrobium methylovorum]